MLEAAVDVPVLGVCLGMQALAVVHGGRVVHAPEPVHGRLSDVAHDGHPLFCGIPSGQDTFKVRHWVLLLSTCFTP